MKKILFVDGYARQILPFLKNYKRCGCHITVVCFSKLDIGYASKYPDEKIILDAEKNDTAKRYSHLLQLVKENAYSVVIPLTDLSANMLSEHKAELSGYTHVAICDYDTLLYSVDKRLTMEACAKYDIPHTKTYFGISSYDDIAGSDLTFPVVVKPRTSYGAIGFHVFYSADELHRFIVDNEIDVSRMVVQEYVPQTSLQYECAMYVDGSGTIKTAMVFSKNRWFPVDGGSSTLNISVENDDIVKSCSTLLQSIGWRGCADVDLIHDPITNTYKVMEINPRVSGSVKICFLSGVDIAIQILAESCGDEVPSYLEYNKDIRLRAMHTDFLWFLKSPNRFKAKPSYFSSKNTHDQIFSLADPVPWFAYTIQGLFKYKTEMKKRS